MADTPTAYPLAWPAGWPRTPDHERQWGPFKMTAEKAHRELIWELQQLGGRYPLVSSNVPVRRDGKLFSEQARKRIDDPGVAVYFERKGRQMVFACDQYVSPDRNLRAIGKTIEALRGIERWGASSMLERSLSAFEALPAPGGWRTTLGFSETGLRPNWVEIQKRYRELVKTHHPDAGGNPDQFRRINEAYQKAAEEFRSI